MGEGALAGMPLQLAGTRKILEYMDWGDDETLGTFVKLGAIGNIQNRILFKDILTKPCLTLEILKYLLTLVSSGFSN